MTIRTTLAFTAIAAACSVAGAQNLENRHYPGDNAASKQLRQMRDDNGGHNAAAAAATATPSTSASADNRRGLQPVGDRNVPASNAQNVRNLQNTQNTQNTQNMQNAQNRDAGSGANAALLVLVPATSPGASDDKLGDGCWVRFYDGVNYNGVSLTLTGPTEMPSIDVPGNLWHNWDSAIVGPKARVTTWDNENYNDRTAVMSPGQRIPDLGDRKLGWFEEIKSAKVTCAN